MRRVRVSRQLGCGPLLRILLGQPHAGKVSFDDYSSQSCLVSWPRRQANWGESDVREPVSRKLAAATALVCATVGLVVVPSSPAGAAPPDKNRPAATTATYDTGWLQLDFAAVGSRVAFTYEASGRVEIRVTDAFCAGDEFAVWVDDRMVGATSQVTTDLSCSTPWTSLPDEAIIDPAYSSATFQGAAGSHRVELRVTESPFGAGTAYVQVRTAEGRVIQPKPLRYGTYNYHPLTALESAEHLLTVDLNTFMREQSHVWSDRRLNWSNDLCSGPDGLEFVVGGVWWEKFWPACVRHDFGYRNFGVNGDPAIRGLTFEENTVTAYRRSQIDDLFRADMNEVCRKQSLLLRQSCRLSAAAFYNGVHFTSWGHNAFFG